MNSDPPIHCRYDAIIPTGELKSLVHRRNPNRHKQKQIDLIGHVIERLGWRHAIVVSRQSQQAVAGNGRIYAAVARGWTGAPVVYQDFESEEAEKAFLLSDNRLAELSDRDDTAVAALLREIGEGGLDTLLSGYDGASVDKLLARIGNPGDPGESADTAPGLHAELVAKWGTASDQVWTLGSHRLVIGDSRESSTWSHLMSEGEQAHTVFCDPPFGVDYEDSKGRTIEGDKLQRDDLTALLIGAFGHACQASVSDCPFYVWHASSTRDDFSFALKAVGLMERQYLTWVKEGFVLGHEDFHWQTEHAFYLSKGGTRPRWYGDRSQSTSWRITPQPGSAAVVVNKEGIILTDGTGAHLMIREAAPAKSSRGKIRHFRVPAGDALIIQPHLASTAWCVQRDATTDYVHPNQKPAALAAIAVKNSTLPGEIVVDMFSGSGSTLIACEEHSRRARCVEKDPRYAAAILERWHRFTQCQPVRAA